MFMLQQQPGNPLFINSVVGRLSCTNHAQGILETDAGEQRCGYKSVATTTPGVLLILHVHRDTAHQNAVQAHLG